MGRGGWRRNESSVSREGKRGAEVKRLQETAQVMGRANSAAVSSAGPAAVGLVVSVVGFGSFGFDFPEAGCWLSGARCWCHPVGLGLVQGPEPWS